MPPIAIKRISDLELCGRRHIMPLARPNTCRLVIYPPSSCPVRARCRFSFGLSKNSRRLLDAAAIQQRRDEAQREVKRIQGLGRTQAKLRVSDAILLLSSSMRSNYIPITENRGNPRGEIDDNMTYPPCNGFRGVGFFPLRQGRDRRGTPMWITSIQRLESSRGFSGSGRVSRCPQSPQRSQKKVFGRRCCEGNFQVPSRAFPLTLS